jgi:dGTPase
MVLNVIETSLDSPTVAMSEPILGATNRLKDFLFANVYTQKNAAKAELAKGSQMLKQLFRLYMERPDLVPGERATVEMDVHTRAVAVLDYIAGMTDRYAADLFLRHFFPREWRSLAGAQLG